ncbi:MAG: MraY family glycosyltransferase [bacterium]
MSSLLSGIVALAAAAGLTLVSLPRLIAWGHRAGLLDRPDQRKRHRQATPFLGGLGLFISVWGSLFVCWLLVPELSRFLSADLLSVPAGALAILLVGLADDIRPVSAWVKLAAQIAIGFVLWLSGLGVDLLVWPSGEIQTGLFSAPITILWVVMLTNAINIIDGLDGLAGGISLIAAVTLLIIGSWQQVGAALLLVWAMVGFLIPFLYYNRFPARVFLGDSGSMQLGYYFAVLTLMLNYKSYAASALYLPLLALGVPVMETAAALARRAISGQNVMQADRRHFFHYLALTGLSPRQVVMVFYVLGVLFGLFALAMFLWNKLLVLGFLTVFMVVILALFLILLSGRGRRKGVGGRSGGK